MGGMHGEAASVVKWGASVAKGVMHGKGGHEGNGGHAW